MSKKISFIVSVLMCASGAQASEYVYTPINPAFGGNPNNLGYLLGTANAQRNATASDFVAPIVEEGGGDVGDDGGNDAADLFVRQLQSRLLSALASQVTDSIFGDNPANNGKVLFGDTEVVFERTDDTIKLVITDFGEGTVTEIIVPQLVTAD